MNTKYIEDVGYTSTPIMTNNQKSCLQNTSFISIYMVNLCKIFNLRYTVNGTATERQIIERTLEVKVYSIYFLLLDQWQFLIRPVVKLIFLLLKTVYVNRQMSLYFFLDDLFSYLCIPTSS